MRTADPSTWVDWQEILLLDSDYQWLATLQRGKSNDGAWTEFTYDLTPWRGETLVLYLNTRNDGSGGRTWMYVDDASVLAILP